MPTPRFLGGSPVSSADNPYNKGAGLSPEDILPSLPIEGRELTALNDLDAYGSAPVTDDAASARPQNPPTLGGQR